MLNQLFQARKLANIDSKYRCTALNTGATRAKGSLFAVMRHALMMMGISAMCTLGVMFVNPDIGDQLLAFSPYADKPSAEQKAEVAQLSALVEAPVYRRLLSAKNRKPPRKMPKRALIPSSRSG